MAAKQLSVVRINHDYDAHLLDELVQEALKPFGHFFEYTGVRRGIEKLQFESSVESKGVSLLGLRFSVVPYLQHRYGNGDMLAIMPYLLVGDRPPFSIDGFGSNGVAFLSTHADYVNPSDPKNFIKYGAVIAAHELGHSAGTFCIWFEAS